MVSIIDLQILISYITVISFFLAGCKFILINPINASIASLDSTIKKLSDRLDDHDIRVSEIKDRLLKLEHDVKINKKSIHELKEEMN